MYDFLQLLKHQIGTTQSNGLFKGLLVHQLHKVLLNKFIEADLAENCYSDPTMECYMIDKKIMQQVIREILETGDYTLEGVAYHTKIPLDVILDVACGNQIQFSITLWVRLVDLYIQVKPEALKILLEKLTKSNQSSTLVLHEPISSS